MALTGLQINKLLPKTNCKECGSNTCLAFAMKLAQKKAELSLCPYASDEAKKVLGAAAEPPVKGVVLGADKGLKLGEETVLYRHEKTFVNQPALAINLNCSDSAEHVHQTLAKVRDYVLERVGEELRVDMISITHDSGTHDDFIALAEKAHNTASRPLVLCSSDAGALVAVAGALSGKGCVLCSATVNTAPQLVAAAKEHGHVLAITAPDLDQLAALAAKIKQDGFNELVLHIQTHSLAETFQSNTMARRAALKDSFKALGYALLRFADAADFAGQTVQTVTEICKYGGICVLPVFDPAQLSVLMTMRLNIFTDPQKPIQVEPKIYPVGEPTAESPVFVTTNFSLTYFLVSGEIESSGVSAWLAVPDCEGMSVLTAWAAGKFSGASVAKFVKESGLEKELTKKQIVVPGYAAVISGELEEGLPGWDVLVGPQEAGDMEGFIKARLA